MMDKADIQLIDDQPENLRVLRKMLAKQKCRVRTSLTGESALVSAFELPPDLILLCFICLAPEPSRWLSLLKPTSPSTSLCYGNKTIISNAQVI